MNYDTGQPITRGEMDRYERAIARVTGPTPLATCALHHAIEADKHRRSERVAAEQERYGAAGWHKEQAEQHEEWATACREAS